MEEEKVLVELNKDEVLVLFEFLTRFSESNKIEIKDKSEGKVLLDVQCILESKLSEPFTKDYEKELKEARANICSM